MYPVSCIIRLESPLIIDATSRHRCFSIMTEIPFLYSFLFLPPHLNTQCFVLSLSFSLIAYVLTVPAFFYSSFLSPILQTPVVYSFLLVTSTTFPTVDVTLEIYEYFGDRTACHTMERTEWGRPIKTTEERRKLSFLCCFLNLVYSLGLYSC